MLTLCRRASRRGRGRCSTPTDWAAGRRRAPQRVVGQPCRALLRWLCGRGCRRTPSVAARTHGGHCDNDGTGGSCCSRGRHQAVPRPPCARPALRPQMGAIWRAESGRGLLAEHQGLLDRVALGQGLELVGGKGEGAVFGKVKFFYTG